jgi:hypothetical protein
VTDLSTTMAARYGTDRPRTGAIALAVVVVAVFVAIVLAAFSAPVATIPPASLFVGAWTLRNHLRLMAYASGHPFVATVSDAAPACVADQRARALRAAARAPGE